MRIEAKEAPASSVEQVESNITSLAVIDTASAALVYAPGALKSLVEKLKDEVRCQLATLDVSLPKDRARIISLSARVAKAKVKLDDMGDSLIEEHRAVVTAVNADRKVMRDDLDAFKIEVRKPVTDLENAEKARQAGHEEVIRQIDELGRLDCPLNLEEIEARACRVSSLADRDWQEFKQRAMGSKAMAMESLSGAQDRAIEARRQREEVERQEAEAREISIKEREEAAAKDAREAEQRKAEEQLRLAQESADRERQRIENERIEAEARAKQAEAEKIAAEERAARELKEAEERRIREAAEAEARRKAEAELAEKMRRAAEQEAQRREEEAKARAERDRQAAVEAERKRVADEARAALAAAEERERNKTHRAKINREAKTGLISAGIPADLAEQCIVAIAKGLVPNVRIEY